MEMKRVKQGFIRLIRIYPFIAIGLLLLIYLLGGFNQKSSPLIPRVILDALLYGLVGVVPVLAISMFIALNVSEDRARNRAAKNLNSPIEEDLFDLVQEKMAGFKIVALSGQIPIFTGVTGDTYTQRASGLMH